MSLVIDTLNALESHIAKLQAEVNSLQSTNAALQAEITNLPPAPAADHVLTDAELAAVKAAAVSEGLDPVTGLPVTPVVIPPVVPVVPAPAA